MPERGVLVVGGGAGIGSAKEQGLYSASKHAVIGLSRSAALDVAGSGVRADCVCPGVIESDLSREAMASNNGLAKVWNGLHPK